MNPSRLVGKWVIICLVAKSPPGWREDIVPLRFARVKKVRVVWGADNVESMAPAFQLKLLLGPWPKTVRDETAAPRYAANSVMDAEPREPKTTDTMHLIASAIEARELPLRDEVTKHVRSWIIAASLGTFPADYSAETWSEVAGAVVQTVVHRRTPLVTMTSFRPSAEPDTHYGEPRWYQEVGDQTRENAADLRPERFPPQRQGSYLVRAGNPYTIRVMFCIPHLAETYDLGASTYGLTTADSAVTTLPAPQVLHPGVFELMDLPFIASANRRRRTVLVLGPPPNRDDAISASLPQLRLALEILPPLSARLFQVLGAALALGAIVASLAGADLRISIPLLTAGIALLAATVVRPER